MVIFTDLQPKNIDDRVLPGLPAYLLFMSIRFADYINDDVKVKSLLSAVVNSVKKTVKVSTRGRYIKLNPRWHVTEIICCVSFFLPLFLLFKLSLEFFSGKSPPCHFLGGIS